MSESLQKPTIADVIIAQSTGEDAEFLQDQVVTHLANGNLEPRRIIDICRRAQSEGLVTQDQAVDICLAGITTVRTFGIE